MWLRKEFFLTLALFPFQVIWTRLSRALEFRGYLKETAPVASSGGWCRDDGAGHLSNWGENWVGWGRSILLWFLSCKWIFESPQTYFLWLEIFLKEYLEGLFGYTDRGEFLFFFLEWFRLVSWNIVGKLDPGILQETRHSLCFIVFLLCLFLSLLPSRPHPRPM